MQEPRKTHMVKPCDTCGGGNDENLIATCRKCNIARAHPYCMQKLDTEAWEDWVCEECLGEENNLASPTDLNHHGIMHPSGNSRVLDNSGWQAHSRRQKPVGTGKVKYISEGEVIRLSSGVEIMRSQRNTFSFKSGQSNSTALMSQGTTFGSKSVIPRSPLPAIKGNPSIVASGHVKLPSCGRNVKMSSISMINQQTSPILKDSKEPKAPFAQNSKKYGSSDHRVVATSPVKEAKSSKLSIQGGATIPKTKTSVAYGKEHIREKQSKDVLVPATSVETKNPVAPGEEHVWEKQPQDVLIPRPDVTSRKKRHTAIEKEPCTVSTMRHSSPMSSPEYNHADAEERDLENKLASLNLNHSSLPALQVTWRGDFIVDTATTNEFIGGFQGRPPCKIHPKAYRFAQTMPPVLEANFIPRSQLWTDIFQDQPPDLQDVGIYFFPDKNIERSRENHARLIERMEKEDSMMRICFDDQGVELLIFTSEQLQLDTQLTSFLWGIFLCTKNYQVEANMADNQSVDMEIDMDGGNMVGRLDVVIPRDPKVTRKGKTSSEVKTRYGPRSNSRNEDGEISSDAEKKELARPPGFSEGSPQSATGSTEGMAGPSSSFRRRD
ncbi:ASI1-immunoprecipitated protein 2-like [Pyrus communis]|uniref:ASI1-immunoprecipitated protein 2-like n=1 Tax=Pyrus communis TaxID=23211 RepID=UPI0035BF3770